MSKKEKAYDMYGSEIKKDDIVVWINHETKTKTVHVVYEEPSKEMVKLWNKYGECEALPSECYIVSTK